jgi:DNA-directed RNA polymerase specialized sigma24 family protein
MSVSQRSSQADEDVLVEFGLRQISGWCVTGKIFERCARNARLLEPVQIDWELAESLAQETVAKALQNLRKGSLRTIAWRKTHGQLMKSAMTMQCLYFFPNIYRRELRHIQKRRRYDLFPAEFDSEVSGQYQVERIVESSEALSEVLFSVRDSMTSTILLAKGLGLSYQEIAEKLDLSESAVKNRIHHFRKRHFSGQPSGNA